MFFAIDITVNKNYACILQTKLASLRKLLTVPGPIGPRFTPAPSSRPNMSTSGSKKNKMATAKVPNSKLQNGSRQSNGWHHVDYTSTYIQSMCSTQLYITKLYCLIFLDLGKCYVYLELSIHMEVVGMDGGCTKAWDFDIRDQASHPELVGWLWLGKDSAVAAIKILI